MNWNENHYHVFANSGLHNAITDPCVSLICPTVVMFADHCCPIKLRTYLKGLGHAILGNFV